MSWPSVSELKEPGIRGKRMGFAMSGINEIFEDLTARVLRDGPVGYSRRVEQLRALRRSISSHTEALKLALNEDFGGRSAEETVLADIIPTLSGLDHTIKNLKKWMRPQRRQVALHFAPASNRGAYHAKGVVLIISPWNYPVSLSLLPLVSALAAGNRIVLKPSECTPRTSMVLARIVEESVPRETAVVVNGDAAVSSALCKLPFDHIMFTGSTRVGRLVMQSAAENLTPVTLELGGKSPAVVHEDYDLAHAALRIARGKLLNGGQTCIAPDYALVPRQRVEEFIELYRKSVGQLYPDIANNPDYTSIINRAQFERLKGLLEDARQKGAKISLIGGDDPSGDEGHLMLPCLVENIGDDMDIAREEIFGPILPIVPYENPAQASAYINCRPRPLALYYFDRDRARVAYFLQNTISGGAAINDTVVQFAQDDLPFGGTGPSGMGVSHGFDGFREFSHARSVFYQARFNPVAFLDPPYSKMFDTIAKFLMR